MSDYTIPGGQEKGVPLAEASPSTIAYWADRIAKSIEDGSSRNANFDKKLLIALRAQQAINAGGTAPATRRRTTTTQTRAAAGSGELPQGQAALTRPTPTALAKLTGAFHTPDQVTSALQEAAQSAHLITPQTTCGALPVGCSVTMSLVWVDADRETYGIPHKDSDQRGLDKTALVKIANAAGLSWDPQLSGRLDDGSDPYYCHYRAVARVKNFDGTERVEMQSKEMDLRDGSDQAEECIARDTSGKGNELRQMRKFILLHAETKAMNRVIRRLGIRTSYKRHELDRPFLVARTMFTGHTDDPALKRLAFEKTFEVFHGARQALYAQPAGKPLAAPQGHPPPPLAAAGEHSSGLDDDDGSYLDGSYEEPDHGHGQYDDEEQPYTAEHHPKSQPPPATGPQQQELKT